ncbi:MAG TPA: 23S rRNA (uracil(1939)-C(5))-methyltransferase RlmD [Candidatus Cloacimonadota bacterium]|jgi:23S rRNA (uracil1939-C5)-methyltransferase|nr:23S rRNA (uracil(1939)-C(5))-methyltransferase RlmD [Candidatus Cloacimonadales bacterium]HPY95832.1 23S rRNA (uracil(1939)-C(5))-methyltransferase RlmD [Candidatus Cloacimonadota bacterium]HQB40534.1 23S rRNA (uracil(1939)-C(5))-methyltransferase RlmD [Candidatus Cloacimonadota bacterium]
MSLDNTKYLTSLKVEKCIHQGYGIAYAENTTVFIENALPNDIVDVEVLYFKKKNAFAQITNIIEPSPLRKDIKCSISDRCGGCNWVNIDYQQQLELKDLIIKDIYKSLDGTACIHPIKPSPQVYHYRNKSFLPLSMINGVPVYGMFERGSHNVEPQRECLLHPLLFNMIADEIIDYVKDTNLKIYEEDSHSGNLRHIGIRTNHDTSEVLLILVTKTRKLPFSKLLVKRITDKFPMVVGIIQNIQPDKSNVILGEEEKVLYGRAYLNEIIDDLKLQVHYKAFYQVNHQQAFTIYQHILNLTGVNKTIIDAYSGTGTIGLILAKRHNKVICIESNSEAIINAEYNAKYNNINNIEFVQGGVEAVLPKVVKDNKIDLIVFDPPRKGIDKKTIELMAALKIPEIIYMSCNPSTQVRDLNLFISKGYYIDVIHPYDMFPHTWHIESLCHLRLQ